MAKFIALILILALRLGYHPSPATSANTPFTSISPSTVTNLDKPTTESILQLSATVNNNKVYLDWQVDQNEKADIFIVEKSTDGITFKEAALIFSSEKSNNEAYQFYEKAGKGKWIYRVILIGKNKQTISSPLVEINSVNS